jgi:hypothetical protein
MKALRIPFVAGALAGVLFVLALLVLDNGGLATLIASDQQAWLPLLMLALSFGGLFGIVVTVSSLVGELPPQGHWQSNPVAVRASSAVRRPLPPNRSGSRRRRHA